MQLPKATAGYFVILIAAMVLAACTSKNNVGDVSPKVALSEYGCRWFSESREIDEENASPAEFYCFGFSQFLEAINQEDTAKSKKNLEQAEYYLHRAGSISEQRLQEHLEKNGVRFNQFNVCNGPQPTEKSRELCRVWIRSWGTLGLVYRETKEFEKARGHWLEAALRGDTQAQQDLGVLYLDRNAPDWWKSRREAGRWLFRAAQQNDPRAQYNLAELYREDNDLVSALMWASLSVERIEKIGVFQELAEEHVRPLVRELRSEMSDEEETKAKKKKDQWRGQGAKKYAGAGSGFYVNHEHILTNFHVVEGCSYVSVMTSMDSFPRFVHTLSEKMDPEIDLAVLYDPDNRPDGPAVGVSKFRNEEQMLLVGEHVIVAGFPHSSRFALDMHVTTGIVVTKFGEGTDGRFITISAPIQGGNSGGPVLDQNGGVAGVVTKRWFHVSGKPVQNVNSALGTKWVRRFLQEKDIPVEENPVVSVPGSRSPLAMTPDISERASLYTVMVECYKEKVD